MFNKVILILLFTIAFSKMLSFADDDLEIVELPQYGEIKITQEKIVALSLAGFEKGDNVYLDFIFNQYRLIYDKFSTEFIFAETKGKASTESKEISSYSYSSSGSTYTYYLKIELPSNYKYLYFYAPRINDVDTGYALTYTIKHSKSSIITIIIVIAVILVILIVVGVLFYLYRRRRKSDFNQSQPYQAQPAYQAPSAY